MNVIITGATDGIGLEMVKQFNEMGAQIIATGRRKQVKELEGNDNITYVNADQTKPTHATKKIMNATKKLKWKKCNYLILNAGIGNIINPIDEKPQDIIEQINVNLTAHILIAHALAPLLFEECGNLVIVGSIAHKGNSQFATYAATKAALHTFARSLEQEWNTKAKVQIIHIAPTKTQMHKKAGANIGWMKNMFVPVNKMAKTMIETMRKKSGVYTISMLKAWIRWEI